MEIAVQIFTWEPVLNRAVHIFMESVTKKFVLSHPQTGIVQNF